MVLCSCLVERVGIRENELIKEGMERKEGGGGIYVMPG